ncbi:MAG: NADH-quinone oxidoreductase subunit H [Sphingobacterium sp.]|nr:NADH-quinone oxidoreductase subunit H [Sphingobacterium sp.]
MESQRDGWFIFKGHIPAFIAFVVFLIASTAETNRGPFDLAEAESELTAGFHTEYSGIKFAFFFLAEYMNMFIVASIAATVFLGGWMPFHVGGWEGFNHIMDYIPPFVWYAGKTAFVIFLMMWFKWTFPVLRIDQLLTLEWKYLLPINLVNIIIMAFISINGLAFLKTMNSYLSNISLIYSAALRSLLQGMTVTGKYFFSPGTIVTQQYPENRKKLEMFDRFKGEVIMPHDENNQHRCTGCGICEINCPNGSIEIITRTDRIDGRQKGKIIDKHIYHLVDVHFLRSYV